VDGEIFRIGKCEGEKHAGASVGDGKAGDAAQHVRRWPSTRPGTKRQQRLRGRPRTLLPRPSPSPQSTESIRRLSMAEQGIAGLR
jgi:hypothetical protein